MAYCSEKEQCTEEHKMPTLFDNIENDFPADFPLKGEKSETRSGTELEKPLDFEDNSPVRPENEFTGLKK